MTDRAPDRTTIAATESNPTGDAATELRAYLIVREASGNRVIDVDDGAQIVFGRSSEATVRLDDPKASREHARVFRRGEVLELVDLESRNGTRLNGQPVTGEAVRLRSGDLVGIGAVEILIAEPAVLKSRAAAPATNDELPGVVIGDPAMVRVFELVKKVAPAPTTVLVLGETGVGKEVVAEQIHRQSPRASGPFVRLNCGSLPESLLESELFGHEKGAFTGADRRKEGHLETAHGGTLFLDEVGELGASTQTKLLRVLENRTFMRVGGRQEIEADLRVLAATNRDLEADTRTGKFRADLYFRLSTFIIRVPPLRERPGEVALLAELFARQLCQRMRLPVLALAPEALGRLTAYDWPGNVRELRNAIEHAVVLAGAGPDAGGGGGPIGAEHLPEALRDGPAAAGPAGPMRSQVADLERKAIREALDAEDGNQTRAARRLGISRRALIYKLEKHGLK